MDQDWRKEDSEWQHEYAYPEIEWQVLMVYEGKVQLKDACTLHLRGSAGITTSDGLRGRPVSRTCGVSSSTYQYFDSRVV